MSHTPPPEDPTEILKALFKKLEQHIDSSIELADPAAKSALQKGLAILSGNAFEIAEPDISVIDGGLVKGEEKEDASVASKPPKLSIHNKIEAAESDTSFPLQFDSKGTEFQLGDGAQVSVHFVSMDDEQPFWGGQSIDRGQINLSTEQQTQTILFSKSERHVRIHCLEGAFDVGAENGMVGRLSAGQSIDVESLCVYVSAEGSACGHYVIVDDAGVEW